MDTSQAEDLLSNGHKFSRLKTTIRSVLRVADNCGHVSLGSGRPINWLKKRTKFSVNKTPPFLCIRLFLDSLTILPYIALGVIEPKNMTGRHGSCQNQGPREPRNTESTTEYTAYLHPCPQENTTATLSPIFSFYCLLFPIFALCHFS